MMAVDHREAGEVSRWVAAAPSQVYELVTAVTQLSTWAVECEGCSWLDGVTGPDIGARFEGRNRYGGRTWSTACVIDELVPDRRFSYHVEADGEPITRWHITLRPDGDGTLITEGFERLALPDATERAFENDLFGGRVRRNLANLEASLERLANVLTGS